MRPHAKDLRRIARKNQNKHYWWAVLVSLVAAILGATATSASMMPSFQFNINFSGGNYDSFGAFGYSDSGFEALETLWRQMLPFLGIALIFASIASVIGIAQVVLAGPVRWGYSRYCLQMHDAQAKKPFQVLFSGFGHFGKTLGLYWMIFLKVFLWSLIAIGAMLFSIIVLTAVLLTSDLFALAVSESSLSTAGLSVATFVILAGVEVLIMWAAMIPAIRAAYSYSMAFYLMVENPNLRVMEAIRCSINLMRGNKWRLFCLDLSFIGWNILNLLSFGILGILFLTPYQEFARTAFYRDLVPAHPVSHLWGHAPQDPPQGGQPLPPAQGGAAPDWQPPAAQTPSGSDTVQTPDPDETEADSAGTPPVCPPDDDEGAQTE